MEYTSIIIPFVGGLGMFIYGMQIMAQGLGRPKERCALRIAFRKHLQC